MPELYNVFPKPILIERGILLDKLECYEQRVNFLKQTNRGSPRNDIVSNMSFQSEPFLQEDNTFTELISEIYKNSNFMLESFGYKFLRNTIKITNMWAVYYNNGEFVYPHVHPGSFLSGVYYIKGAGNITFMDKLDSMTRNDTESEIYTPVKHFSCDTGTMLIWKSDILHATQPATDLKVAISFNLS
jgi:uncharacterized protein (TIGR02466 family)